MNLITNLTRKGLEELLFVNSPKTKQDIQNQIDVAQRIRSDFLNYNGKIPEMEIDFETAIEIGKSIVWEIVCALEFTGINLSDLLPAHGKGHARNNLWMILWLSHYLKNNNVQTVPKIYIIISIISGPFLDSGLLFMDRYSENERIIKHAEMAAILVSKLLQYSCTMQEIEKEYGFKCAHFIKSGVSYSIAAHTHYLIAQKALDHTMEPYKYKWSSGLIYSVIFTRWADRMNCLGSHFLFRHFLSLYKDHMDFDGAQHKIMEFENTMYPFVLTEETKEKYGYTFRDHYTKRAISMTDDSPYTMGEIKNTLMTELREIRKIDSIVLIQILDKPMRKVVERQDLHIFLRDVIGMCNEKGEEKIKKLLDRLYSLDEDTKQRWLSVFTRGIKSIKNHLMTKEEKLAFDEANQLLKVPQ